MTRTLLILLTLLISVVPAMADNKEPSADKLKELREFKIKYLIQEMELPTDKQAEFTKLYTQYESERISLFKELHQRAKSVKNNANATDTDYSLAAEAIATARTREGELEAKYFQKFKAMLTPKQLYQLKRSEQKFERKLGEMKHQNKGKNKK